MKKVSKFIVVPFIVAALGSPTGFAKGSGQAGSHYDSLRKILHEPAPNSASDLTLLEASAAFFIIPVYLEKFLDSKLQDATYLTFNQYLRVSAQDPLPHPMNLELTKQSEGLLEIKVWISDIDEAGNDDGLENAIWVTLPPASTAQELWSKNTNQWDELYRGIFSLLREANTQQDIDKMSRTQFEKSLAALEATPNYPEVMVQITLPNLKAVLAETASSHQAANPKPSEKKESLFKSWLGVLFGS